MAKWHKESGLTKLQTRDAIFTWGKRNGVHITCNVNNVINSATADKRRLANNISISISDEDVAEINRRFDKQRVKLVALAVLCYAKAFADRDGIFTLSSVELGAWIGIDSSLVRKSYISELLEYDYLEVIEARKTSFRWDDKSPRANRYRIRVPINKTSNTYLVDNDIQDLFSRLF